MTCQAWVTFGVKNGKIIIWGIKLFLKSLFHLISINMGSFGARNQDSEEKVWFLLIERFVCNFENSIIRKLTTDFENRQKHRFTPTQCSMKGQSIKAISSKTDYGWISTLKNQLSCTLSVSLRKFKIVIKWFLSKEYDWSLFKLKHQLMKQIFDKIYWNPANLTREAAGERYALI